MIQITYSVARTYTQLYGTNVLKGYGVHFAKRDIAAGEQITTNYLNGIFFMSTRERRTKLLDQVGVYVGVVCVCVRACAYDSSLN